MFDYVHDVIEECNPRNKNVSFVSETDVFAVIKPFRMTLSTIYFKVYIFFLLKTW